VIASSVHTLVLTTTEYGTSVNLYFVSLSMSQSAATEKRVAAVAKSQCCACCATCAAGTVASTGSMRECFSVAPGGQVSRGIEHVAAVCGVEAQKQKYASGFS